MKVTEKIVSILVLAATLTGWSLLGAPAYEAWVQSVGGTVGVGEVFLGFLIPATVSMFITFIIIKRLRRPAEDVD